MAIIKMGGTTLEKTLNVYQVDEAPGLPLLCGGHPDSQWCGCRTKVVTDNMDGLTLWHAFMLKGTDSFDVTVHVTKSTSVRVEMVLEDQWHPDREDTQLAVSLGYQNIYQDLPPFKDDESLLQLGTLNYGEGRGTLRELIINRFASILYLYGQGCASKFHGKAEQEVFLKSRTHPALQWDWDYAVWLNKGICEECKLRAERRIKNAVENTVRDTPPRAYNPLPAPTNFKGRMMLDGSRKTTG